MNLGETIIKLRKKKGLTQYELAARCNITPTYLSLLEKNKRDAKLSTLKSIVQELEIPFPLFLILSLTEEDIQPEKQESYKILEPIVKNLIEQLI